MKLLFENIGLEKPKPVKAMLLETEYCESMTGLPPYAGEPDSIGWTYKPST